MFHSILFRLVPYRTQLLIHFLISFFASSIKSFNSCPTQNLICRHTCTNANGCPHPGYEAVKGTWWQARRGRRKRSRKRRGDRKKKRIRKTNEKGVKNPLYRHFRGFPFLLFSFLVVFGVSIIRFVIVARQRVMEWPLVESVGMYFN